MQKKLQKAKRTQNEYSVQKTLIDSEDNSAIGLVFFSKKSISLIRLFLVRAKDKNQDKQNNIILLES